jgi:predicted nucleic acid-binding protein
MYSIDANIFIYAAIKGHDRQAVAEEFLNRILSTVEPCYLCWETLHAFIRIVTNPSIFLKPMAFAKACEYVEKIIQLAQVEMLSPTLESFRIFSGYAEIMPLKGKIVSDAIIASQLEAAGVRTIYTTDRDFSKFPGLKPKNPFPKA